MINPAITTTPMPARIQRLPVDPVRGIPVPWFVAWVDGKPEFRAADASKQSRAIREGLCWVCGEPLDRQLTFVIGPMCAVNRVSAEPPCHADCAEYSARACPFLTRPRMERREGGLPADCTNGAGEMIKRNPGCCVLWTTTGYALLPDKGSCLFCLGEPTEVVAYAEGKVATAEQVRESFDSGLPILEALADADPRRADARRVLRCQAGVARKLLGIGRKAVRP